MYKEILNLLRCPKCHGSLKLTATKEENDEIIEGKLECCSDHHWLLKNGVINFGSEEQQFANNWTEFYKQTDYESVDKEVLAKTPENLIQINSKAKNYIIDKINNSNSRYVLDIATGRGMLLTEMAVHLKETSRIICTDLSFEVLKYDRLKAKKINPRLRANYIACDATNLPFNNYTVDTAVSFYGITNMATATADGINEAYRVLKNNHNLYNTVTIIKKDSEGFKAASSFCKENNMSGAENFYLKPIIEKAHIAAGFSKTDIITIEESLGEKNELDLLPYEGEWFAVSVFNCTK
ncbi:MAG: methyltransferase domain-containing protein [Inconstantimicrobium porci]|uniref:class I SAM-dependent methyltransferase n=1 Tax=Inconstantimicrobium porci TaxID=2652291 RepID=UPI002408FBED|nr:class I SAM-dependent methyltransferase [Inconstantimicrobium porci]MDD6771510.1 methyltransferase domain-containing protein [Inconstantimicrobium porci]MDY5910846.1 methyltransferase domain-containing protein [Inconstantimicrobium porci]